MKLYFLHIPRTGGTSLLSGLGTTPGVWVHPDPLMKKDPSVQIPIIKEDPPGKIIIRHAHYLDSVLPFTELHPELPPRFTWLRDPFDTLVSLYALWVSVWDRRPILYETCDKDKYQDFPSFVEGNLSGASRYLGTDPAALDHFTFVGIAERSQACYTALCKQLGIQSSQLPRTNAAPRPPDVDYDLREVHRELHPVEYEIYDYALRTWQEKW